MSEVSEVFEDSSGDLTEPSVQGIAQRHARLIEHSPVCIHEVDLQGRLMSMNPRGLAMMGVESLAEIAGMPYLDAVCIDDRERVAGLMQRAIDGERVDFEFTAAGGERPLVFSSNFIPILDESGSVDRMMGITEDITDRLETETRLKASEERYRTVVETTPNGCWLTDEAGRGLDVNDALAGLTGYSKKDLMARPPWEFARDEADRVWLRRMLLPSGEGRHESREIVLIHASGGDVVVRFHVTSLAYTFGGGARSFSIVMDLTLDKQREARAVQAQKLEAVGQLTGGIAHDFNNLLTVVSGNAELLAEALEGTPASADLLASIRTAADRGAELTQKLLAFSRRQVLAAETVDVRVLIGGMLSLLQRTLGADIEVEAVCDDDPCWSHVDVGQLESAILNLAINGRDAMPGGGTLRIEVHRVELTVGGPDMDLAPGAYVRISVVDTGVGISKDVAARAFEPFFSTKPIGSASGLGLSSVFGFARQSGGHAVLQPASGGGVCVSMWLPRTVPPGVQRAGSTPAGRQAGRSAQARRRLLLVEDEVSVLALLGSTLAGAGFEVLTAVNGDEALAHLRSPEPLDLLLTDLMLPGGVSGAELGRLAEELRPGIRVLYMSGYAEDAVVRKLGAEWSGQILQKPFRLGDALERVREALAAVPE